MTRGSRPTQDEFHQAVTQRADRWYAACLRITRSPELAEDAMQQGLLSAWEKRDQYNGDGELAGWIHRIAVNAALQLIRKRRPGSFEALDGDVPDDSDAPEHARQQHDVGEHLADALRHLTESERVCFLLKHMEQWRIREIAEELGTSESNVKQSIFRGVRKLRKKMVDIRSPGS